MFQVLAFSTRQDMTDCKLISPTSQYTVKCFVCTSAVPVSESLRQEGGLQCFVNATASSVATQLLQGGEKAPGCCPALQAEALRRLSSARCKCKGQASKFLHIHAISSKPSLCTADGSAVSSACLPSSLGRPEGKVLSSTKVRWSASQI